MKQLKIDINHYLRAKSTLKIAKTDVANVKQFQEGMDLDLDLDLMRTGCLVQVRKLCVGYSWVKLKGNLCKDWFNARIIKYYPDDDYFNIVYLIP